MIAMGQFVEVAIDGWAGRGYVPALVLKVCRKRVKVQWCANAYQRRMGRTSYVPTAAIREIPRQTEDR